MLKSDTKYFSTIRLIVLLLICTMPIMADFTISAVLPKLSSEFSSTTHSELLVKLVLSLPALFIAISSPIMGFLADRFGRKLVIVFCVLLYIIAGTTALYLDSLYYILIGRAFLGLSIGGIITISITLVGDYYEGPNLNKYMGIQSGTVGFAGVLFLITGGILADYHWRLPFIVYLIPIIYLIFTLIYINEPEKKALTKPLNTPSLVNHIPIRFLILTYFLAFLAMAIFYMVPIQLPFYLKQLGNNSNTLTGIIIGTGTFVSAISSLLYKEFKSLFSFNSIFLITFSLMSVGYIYLSLINHYIYALIGSVLIGFSIGLIIPNLSVMLIVNVPEDIRAKAIGGYTCTYFLGQFMSPVIVHPIVYSYSIRTLFMTTGILMLISVTLLLTLKFLYKR